MPLLLVAGPAFMAGMSFPCIGTLHVGTAPGFSDLTVLVDGRLGTFPDVLFRLNPNGSASQSFSVPAGLPPLDIQGVVFQPIGAGCALKRTAAHYLVL